MYEIGEHIADMHNGNPTKDYQGNKIKVLSTIELETDNAVDIVQHMVTAIKSEEQGEKSPYDFGFGLENKYALYLGMVQHNNRNDRKHLAMWSYDGRRVGLICFEIVEEDR